MLCEQDASLSYLQPASWPMWLQTSKWKPDFMLTGDARAIIAVDIALSGSVPHMFYSEIVGQLLRDHKKLKVLVCLPRALFDQSHDTAKFCQGLGIEVRLMGFGLGLETVPLTLPAQPALPLPRSVGQFPQPI